MRRPSGAELSATATLRRRQLDATSLRRLLPIRETLVGAAEVGDPDTTRALTEVQALIAARSAVIRAEFHIDRTPRPSSPAPRQHRSEGLQR